MRYTVIIKDTDMNPVIVLYSNFFGHSIRLEIHVNEYKRSL